VGRESTKQLTESALLMAVSIVLFFGAFIPLLGILVAPFSPVPLCILTIKYGIRHGLLVALVTLGILSLMFSVVLGGAFVPFVFVGLTLGTFAHRRVTGLRVLVGGTAATVLVLLAMFYCYEAYAGRTEHMLTIAEFWERKFAGATRLLDDMTTTTLRNAGGMATALREGLDTLRWLVAEVFRFPLAFFTVLGGLGFGMSFFVATHIVGKLGFPFPVLPSFGQWQGSLLAAAALGCCYPVTMYLMRDEAWRAWRLFAVNVLFVLLSYHIVTGLALVEYHLGRWGIDAVLRFVVLVLALRFVTFPPAPLLLVAAVLDPIVDLRSGDLVPWRVAGPNVAASAGQSF